MNKLSGVPNFDDIEWRRDGIDISYERRLKEGEDSLYEFRRLVTLSFSGVIATTSTGGGNNYSNFILQPQMNEITLNIGNHPNKKDKLVKYIGPWNVERMATTDNHDGCSILAVILSKSSDWKDEMTTDANGIVDEFIIDPSNIV